MMKNQKSSESSSSPDAREEAKVDRISHLPDAVLSHILSFIPTKYCIRTSILSKRWEHLWVLASKLDLVLDPIVHYKGPEDQYDTYEELCANSFTHSVDNLLFLRDNLCIESFQLFCCCEKIDLSRPRSWLSAVVMCNLRELDLNVSRLGLGELPWCLFTCKTLVVLNISGSFLVNVPYNVCLPSLKTLHLSSVEFLGDASVHKLLSGCPALEDLQLIRHEWDHLCVLDISLSSLKRLTLRLNLLGEDYYQEGDFRYKVTVDAPNLEYIDLQDCWTHDIFVNALPSIVEAHIDINKYFGYQDQNGDQGPALLMSVKNVRRLFLSEETMNSLGIAFEYNDYNLPTFCNLVHLELSHNPHYGPGPVLLNDFLRSSPKLEVLSLPCGMVLKAYALPHGGHWSEPDQVPECLLYSLKSICIQQFTGEKDELKFVKYLLKNAMVLEKMALFCDHLPTSAKYIELHSKITNYPRRLNFIVK